MDIKQLMEVAGVSMNAPKVKALMEGTASDAVRDSTWDDLDSERRMGKALPDEKDEVEQAYDDHNRYEDSYFDHGNLWDDEGSAEQLANKIKERHWDELESWEIEHIYYLLTKSEHNKNN